MNRRGASGFVVGTVIVLFLIVIFIFFANGGSLATENFKGLLPQVEGETFAERIAVTHGFETVFGDESEVAPTFYKFLNYIFGKVPEYLIVLTGGTPGGEAISAGIIILGIWLLLLLSFADITRLFGTFSTATSWVAAVVLTIIAANVKLVTIIAVFMLSVTAAFGAFSVFMGLILAFIIFLGIQFGSEYLRKFAEAKKISEMKMRVAMGSERAAEGLKASAGFGKAVEDAGK